MSAIAFAILTATFIWADVQYVKHYGKQDYPYNDKLAWLIVIMLIATVICAVVGFFK